nr:AbrB/MazE/SpoVT family DNA-binding domain-containing protein [Paenibacillus sp. L3-i20]
MKSTGIIRKTDDLGRVVIPKELRTSFGIGENDGLEIFTQGNTIVLKKYEPGCTFCGDLNVSRILKGKHVCMACVGQLK